MTAGKYNCVVFPSQTAQCKQYEFGIRNRICKLTSVIAHIPYVRIHTADMDKCEWNVRKYQLTAPTQDDMIAL